jgi:HECT-domain (ubiquitin-transferase)
MFPLPLSASFLRLVQNTSTSCDQKQVPSPPDCTLCSYDLPRPGFLGGEVFAADRHICPQLDKLDRADPPLSRFELEKKYTEIAKDKDFARVAFGKSFDCSFEEYFQDRTFVDPLDPTQGEDAVPLCSRGARIPVTIYNVREWVRLAKDFILNDGVSAQATAFREGVEDFFPATYLSLFTADELQRDVCGTGDDVDNWNESSIRRLFKLDKGTTEALVAVAAIGGEGGAALSRRFGPSSPTIAYLVKALLEATPKQRRQFLSFVTSVPIVTPGKIEVVPVVSPSGDFLPMHDPSCLPRANTCARRMYVPKFESYESFSHVLWKIVEEESQFKGFYEWRG